MLTKNIDNKIKDYYVLLYRILRVLLNITGKRINEE